jgi:hypothetical protein
MSDDRLPVALYNLSYLGAVRYARQVCRQDHARGRLLEPTDGTVDVVLSNEHSQRLEKCAMSNQRRTAPVAGIQSPHDH